MTNITILGIDLAKNVFELCGIGASGEVVYTRSVKRKDFFRIVCQLDVKTVAMEACGSAHHWHREFTTLGIEVKLLHPHYVKPFVKTRRIISVSRPSPSSSTSTILFHLNQHFPCPIEVYNEHYNFHPGLIAYTYAMICYLKLKALANTGESIYGILPESGGHKRSRFRNSGYIR